MALNLEWFSKLPDLDGVLSDSRRKLAPSLCLKGYLARHVSLVSSIGSLTLNDSTKQNSIEQDFEGKTLLICWISYGLKPSEAFQNG